MDLPAFDADIVQLLRERVTSVEGLEALLLLRRTRGRTWAAADVAARLGLPEDGLLPELERLEKRGLATSKRVEGELVWAYAPRSLELDAVVARLAELHDARTLEVVRFLSADAVERIRMAAARAFTDPSRRGERG
jgi:hypothetical protein